MRISSGTPGQVFGTETPNTSKLSYSTSFNSPE